jgi:hypothetical protein
MTLTTLGTIKLSKKTNYVAHILNVKIMKITFLDKVRSEDKI